MKRYLLWHMTAVLAGYVSDLIVGDPHGIPHPVVAIGKLTAFLERKLYPDTSRGRNPADELRRGAVLCCLVLMAAGAAAGLILFAAYRIHAAFGMITEAVMTCYALAAKSLVKESMKVCTDLEAGDLIKARADLSMIVGRDTENLDAAAVTRAAVETVAENASDGVIAPLFYLAIGGPVAGYLYKAVNTMDSMVGYHNERYEYFGRPAARLDDAVNYIPSRLSALLMIAAAGALGFFTSRGGCAICDARRAFAVWRRDRRNHKSPNSAQTESVCAGALGIRLGGRSFYQGVPSDKPYIGDDLRKAEPEDVRRANRLMLMAELLAVALIVLVFLVFFIL